MGQRGKDRAVAGARRLVATLLLTVASLAVAGALGEALLRLFPALIGRAVLLEFDRTLRAEIAAELGLPLKQARRCLSPAERLDHGPELCLMEPGFVLRMAADPADAAEGAAEEVRHDARGFCNPPAAAARAEVDVVVLGDSLTRCTFVTPDATFPARLGDRLEVTSYDLGVAGVGPHEYLEVLRRFGLGLRPRVVVLAIYEGNDLRDAARFAEHRARMADPEEAAGRAAEGPRSWGAALMRHSRLLNLVAGSVELLANRLRRPDVDFGYEVAGPHGWRPMNVTNGDVDEPRTAARLARGEIGPELWEAPLHQLAALGAEHGFVPLVAYLPAAYTAYANGIRFDDPTIGAAMAEMSRRQRAFLHDLAPRLGMALVDCTAPLQAAAPAGPLAYFPANVHLTATGHELVADCLLPGVRDALGRAPPRDLGRAEPADKG